MSDAKGETIFDAIENLHGRTVLRAVLHSRISREYSKFDATRRRCRRATRMNETDRAG